MGRKILIVDDEPDMRMLLRLTLDRAGFEIFESATGEEALVEVEKNPFDLVLLDLNLPGISGLQTLEAWHKDGTTSWLPVLMITADAREEPKEEAMRLGCREYLQKPITPAQLVTRVEEALGGYGAPAVEGT